MKRLMEDRNFSLGQRHSERDQREQAQCMFGLNEDAHLQTKEERLDEREAGQGERGRTKAGAIRVRGGSKGVDVGREG